MPLAVMKWLLGLSLAKTADNLRVAFVIAGSPRSFIYPAVHESIRVNLISAFCPIDSCVADIFARVSLTDNTHQNVYGAVKDSKGIRVSGLETDAPLIRHGLTRLLADRNESQGTLSVTWVDIGSSAEHLEMIKHFNSTRHQVFRELDPRRYSMYFGRWAVFQQARSYEKAQALRYSWFVHTRFDMAFGKPIQLHSYFNPNKVWVHSMWTADVPDIFALLPQEYADGYFSLDMLVQEGVMCLGGPNFDLKILTTKYLKQLGYPHELMTLAVRNSCPTVEWGYSEAILSRKLAVGGITLQLGAIDYEPIFSVVIRKTLSGFCCTYTHPDTQLEGIWDTHTTNSAFYSGCVSMLQQFRELHLNNRYLNCHPIPPMSKKPYTGSCMLNPKVSEFNYMPFRIRLPRRLGDGCLTVNEDVELEIKPCVAYERIARHGYKINGSYSISQLFNLHPHKKSRQYIGHNRYSKLETDHVCIFRTYGDETVSLGSCSLNMEKSTKMMRLRFRRKVSEGQKLLVIFDFDTLCPGYFIGNTDSKLVWLNCPSKGAAAFDREKFGVLFELERTQ